MYYSFEFNSGFVSTMIFHFLPLVLDEFVHFFAEPRFKSIKKVLNLQV